MFRLHGGFSGFFLPLLFSAVSYADVVTVDKQTDDRVLFSQAVNLSIHNDWAGAEKIFKKISLAHPDWPEPKNNLAIVLFNQGKIEQAQQIIEQAVSSLPSFKVAQENRKRLYDHSAAMAYHKVVGSSEKLEPPKLQLLDKIDLPVAEIQQDEQPSTKIIEQAVAATSTLKLQTLDTVVTVVNAWAESWSNLNEDKYISAYSLQFKPVDSLNDHAQWQNERRQKFRLANNVSVELQDIKTYFSNNETQALVEFVQLYKSNKYKDRVIKQLLLVLENDRWLIQSERVLQQLN